MDKIISFGKGIRRQPSVGEDGELSELVNLIPKNGELVNVREMTKADVQIENGDIVVACHKTQSGDNYIAFGSIEENTASLYYYNERWERKPLDEGDLSIADKDHLPHVEMLGNTISVLCADSIRYYLWKDGGYISLGSKPPQMNISFGLQCEGVRSEVFQVEPENGFRVNVENGVAYGNPSYQIDDVEDITNSILSQVNKFIQEESVDKGRFMYPFFVRYAYRLYDDSLIMHSSPVLMVCSTKCTPKVDIKKFYDLTNGVAVLSPKADFQVVGVTSALDFLPTSDFEELKKWGDIVKSVDIFITEPIYTYNQNERVGRIVINTKPDESNYVVAKHVNRYAGAYTDYPDTYQRISLDMVYGMTFSSNISINRFTIELPAKTEDEIRQEIKESSLFYFLDSFSIEKLSEISNRTIITPKEDILKVLATREAMSDDYYSNDALYADYALAYNSRLTLSGVKSVFSNGKLSNSLFTYTDGYFVNSDNPSQFSVNQDISYYVYIKEEGKDIIVGGSDTLGKYGTLAKPCNKLLYFFFPNPNAYKLVIRAKRVIDSNGSPNIVPNDWKNYTVNLEKHNLLNGAFFFGDWENGIVETSDKKGYTDNKTIQVSTDKTVYHRGYIYTSEVNNPFAYHPSGINDIGFGDIIKIETAAKALSPSQFGQFPLYAFCTDGIWALEVDRDGTYFPPQIISNDVCNNKDSITQIESSVVFTTDQGLKMIQGSEVVLLSGAMDGHNVDERTYFKEGFFAAHKTSEYDGLEEYDKLVVQETRDFRQILAKCKIAYDYPNQMLRIFPEGESGKYYVYSLASREFASVIYEGVLKSIVSGYPSSLLQIGTSIYTFEATISEGLKRGLLLTRPIDMGEPFALKKLQDMRMHYTKYAEGSKCSMVVYVSNDGVNWYVLPSLRKCSFKYYRIAIITHLSDDDRLSGLIMRYEVERTNKIR